tara:strand:- start:3297 stop:4226 length:930 start_codon:yes stop_codon:yes gene_type:complete
MKISQQKLKQIIRQIIKEAPFAEDLGSIESETDDDISFLGGVSSGIAPYMIQDADEETKKKIARQKKAARHYATGKSFKEEAKKRYKYLDANVFVLSQIGSFSFKPGTVSNTKRREFLPSGVQKRVTFNKLGEKAFNFLKQVKPDIDLSKVKNTDTIIYYQTDAIGSKQQTYKMTPWMIIHAIIDSLSFRRKLSELTNIDFYKGLSGPLHPTKYVYDIMTTGSSNVKKNFGSKAQLGTRYPTDDAIAEMICQELLTQKGVHFNREGLSLEENGDLDKIEFHIKEIANWFQEYMQGKLIVVDGHISQVRT